MFALTVFHRDRLVARSTFAQEEVRIGRSPDNEVMLDNLGVSRYHASIAAVGGVHIVKDFGSDNGTFVNGERVQGRRALDDGDRIQLGKFTVVFRGPRGRAESADVRDAASFALAGNTIVTAAPLAAVEKRCPFQAFLELGTGSPPRIHRLETDVCIVGAPPEAELALPPPCPPRAALILRGWSGFSVLGLDPQVRRNGEALVGRAPLRAGDTLSVGTQTLRFFVDAQEAAP